MTVSVLVPYRRDYADRDLVWAWMRERWELTMPDCELVVCSDGSERDQPFNEGKAWNRCALEATGDIFVLAESEVANNPADLRRAIDKVESDGGWAIAERYYQLSRRHTKGLLAEPPQITLGIPANPDLVFWGTSVASNIVVPREAYDLVGGYDERYEGWGWIDKAMAWTLDTLYEPHHRFHGPNFHLWHPRPQGSHDSNAALTRRYKAAAGDPDAIRGILAERPRVSFAKPPEPVTGGVVAEAT